MRSKNFNISSYPTIQNYLFRAVILTKNADIDKCKCSGYGIVFDRHGFYSLPSDGTGRNVIIFGVVWVHLQRLTIGKKIF